MQNQGDNESLNSINTEKKQNEQQKQSLNILNSENLIVLSNNEEVKGHSGNERLSYFNED